MEHLLKVVKCIIIYISLGQKKVPSLPVTQPTLKKRFDFADLKLFISYIIVYKTPVKSLNIHK